MRRGRRIPDRVTTPVASNATNSIADRNPKPWMLRVLIRIPNGPGQGAKPLHRSNLVQARRSGGESQPEATSRMVTGWRPTRALVRSRPMAKAKRRRLRARRKKANHGRRPNAGRGK